MNERHTLPFAIRLSAAALCMAMAFGARVSAQNKVVGPAPTRIQEVPVGPYAAHIAAGGPAIVHTIPQSSTMLWSNGVSTLIAWVKVEADTPATTLFAGVGDPAAEESRFLGLSNHKPIFRMGRENTLAATTPFTENGWHLLAAVLDGTQAWLYVDGKLAVHGPLLFAAVAPELRLAPIVSPLVSAPETEHFRPYEFPFEHFGGALAGVELIPQVLSATAVHELFANPPDEALLPFEQNSPPWSVQLYDHAGYLQPQDPSTMPRSLAPFAKPVAQPAMPLTASGLTPLEDATWALRSNWYLTPAPQTTVTVQPFRAAASTRKDGGAPPFPAPCSQRWSIEAFIPHPNMVSTTWRFQNR